MPRSRGGAAPSRSAPSRPSAPAPSRPAPQQQQQRPMSTATAQRPQQAHPPAAQQSQGPGLFGQMASTAAGVAVGSSIGHAIGGFFGGGSSSQQASEQSYQQPADSYAQPGQAMDSSLYSANTQSRNMAEERCGLDAKNFTKCLDDNQGNMQICQWYLDQLKACQAAARGY